MLSAFAIILVLQQAAGSTVVWETPSAPPEPVVAAPAAVSDLPAWALADPFAWERAECNPMIRRDSSLESCQTRVRGELFAALGDRLPAGLLPSGTPVPCLATPGEDGAYPVQCGVPERTAAAAPSAQAPDCRPRPTRQGGSVAFVTECRTEGTGENGGLSFRLGKD
ncbi:hypothetical protein [Brevundimonas sp. R86498]|uniref:hypothetical protein n=1 Tax=Brevundimonas sp. R86498 TaxID=3093845 RepID=UPI0037C6261A